MSANYKVGVFNETRCFLQSHSRSSTTPRSTLFSHFFLKSRLPLEFLGKSGADRLYRDTRIGHPYATIIIIITINRE